jgi:acyl-coenzyme A thioesterase PaaI-like protein
VTLIAEGRVIKVGRTIAVADGTISDANGSIYAHGSATYMLKQPAK